MKAGIGKEKAALLVVIGVKKDGSKGYIALQPGYRASMLDARWWKRLTGISI